MFAGCGLGRQDGECCAAFTCEISLALAIVGCGDEGSLNQLKLMMIHRHIDPADDGGADG
jgi:hypothetical protein